jgi:uncharacterized protein YlzI (FlbEa/FlbD family)
MIQSLQATPDTVITFTNHDCLMVKEPVEEISQRIVEYQRLVSPVMGNESVDMLDMMVPASENLPSAKSG